MADSSLVFRLFGRDISLGRALKSASRDAETLNKHLKGVGSVGGSAVKLTGTALAASYMGASAASAAGSIVSFTAALAPASGIIAALPAGALLAAGAIATLKVATSGMGDAFKAALSGDLSKFNEAVKDLSPAARAVATEFRNIKPVLDDLKRSVQDALFKPLVGEIKATATALAGPLKTGMSGVASEFGNLGSKVSRFARETRTVRLVGEVFSTLKTQISGAGSGLTPLLQGLRDFAGAALPAFKGAGNAIGALATKLGTFLSEAANSGKALEWIETAKGVFKQLGTIAGNIGGIIGSVFRAAQGTGGGLLGTLGQITGTLREFFNSAKGQEALTSIFSGLASIGSALMPVIRALGVALGQVAPHIGNIATALGPGLAVAVSALGPALTALGPGLTTVAQALSDAFASPEMKAGLIALGNGLSTALTALAPIIPVVGQIVGIIGQLAGTALTNLGSALGPVISALAGALKPALSSISTAFEQLAPLMQPLYSAFGTLLGAVITQLLPPILQLVPSLLNGLVPAFVQIAEAIIPLIPDLTDLAVLLISQVLPAIIPLIPMAVKLGVAFAQIGVKVASWVAAMAPKIEAGVRIVRSGISTIKGWIGRLSEIPGQIAAWFGRAKEAIVAKWNSAVAFVKGIPAKIKAGLGNLKSLLLQAGRDVIQGLINGIKGMASQAASAARNVVSNAIASAKNALGIKSPSKVFTWIGQMTTKGLVKGLLGGTSEVKSTSKKLSDTVLAAWKGKRISFKFAESLLTIIDRDNTKLQALATKRESILKRIEEAQKFATDVSDKARSTATLASLDFGEGQKASPGGIRKQLSVKLSQIKRFSTVVRRLAARGLNKNLLRQVIEAGPEEGLELGEALLRADAGTLKSINSAQSSIDSAATSLGKFSADVMYDSGKQAGKGFLTGLMAQKKDILAAIDNLANSLVQRVRKALKIKSPSQVLHALGAYTGQGFAGGILSEVGSVESASDRLAGAAVPTAGSRPVGPQYGAQAAASNGGGETKVIFDGRGIDGELLKMLRKMVRVEGGGSVQTAFGKA
ncbi:phage tail protein [Nonomuraea wenchangensis]|uniref:Phage-related protein n=1 Tax=Nonomuraea wenchangensis TaxID=568860 RepID=A0A1I0EFC4_9ACTN|nr:hypothetical protein [Nonomuraea wenchangensis]SET43540.1 Phage-related protein [Nonomuraea wenchangensis]